MCVILVYTCIAVNAAHGKNGLRHPITSIVAQSSDVVISELVQ